MGMVCRQSSLGIAGGVLALVFNQDVPHSISMVFVQVLSCFPTMSIVMSSRDVVLPYLP